MSNDRAKGRKTPRFYLDRVGRMMLACILVAVAIWPVGIQPQATQAAPVYAPPTPTPIPPPLAGEGEAAQAPQTPPSPDNLPPEVEQARARQAMEAALAKYLRYWGPRYQVAPIEVIVEGKWAHGVAQWQSTTKTLSGPIHILAHRSADGIWQALLPGGDGLYRQWVDAVPESLVPAGEKSQLHAQAAEADALRRPQATPAVPPAATPMPPSKEGPGEPVEPVPGLMQPTATPTPSDPIALLPTLTPFPQPETWIAGETSVSRLSEQERAKLCGVTVEAIEWERLQASREIAGPIALDYPSAKDWRNVNGQDWTTTIKRQGGCGSCVAFGTVAAIESRMEIANNTPGLNPDLSEAHLFYCGCGECCEFGWDPSDALNFARDTGIADESCYPYTDQDQACSPCADWQSRATKITRWTGTSNVAEMKQALAYNGPFEATMAVYDDFYSYLGGIYRHTWGNLADYHAVTIVGYDDNGGYWIGKNSWGTVWGEDKYGNPYGGWFRIAYGECGIDDYAHIPVVPGDDQVKLYSLANFDGSIVFSGGTGFSNDPNADSYSMEIPSEWSVKTWREDNRGGEERCWSESVPNLQDHGWHLAIQSIEVFDHDVCPQQVKLWSLANYEGSVVFSKGTGFSNDPNADSYSMEIPSGWSVRTWRGDNRSGEERCWSESVPNLQDHGWHLAIQSIEIFDSNVCGQVRLWSLANYEGSVVFSGGTGFSNDPNADSYSMEIPSGWSVYTWRGDNRSGEERCWPQSVPNLQDHGWHLAIQSIEAFDHNICPPAPPSLQSPGNGSTFNEGDEITLYWSATGDEYYGEAWDGQGGTLTFGWQSGTSKGIGSQPAGYTYSWHVKARNTADESDWSSTWTFTVKPATPSNLSAQTASCSQINLTWDDNSGNEEGYRIYRNGSYAGQVGMNTTSYQDTGLSEDTDYSYYVRAFRGSIESNNSNTVDVHTPICLTGPDLVPVHHSHWQYPIIPSSVPDTEVPDTLYANQWTYVDWGVHNIGDTDSMEDVYGEIYLDSTRLASYNFSNVLAGWAWTFYDWPSWIQSEPGWHTLKVVVDLDDLVAESDETNNVWEHQFYWEPSCDDQNEPNDTPSDATFLSFGQTRSANICGLGDYDYYRFTGTAGQKIVVDINAEVDGSLLDSYLSLFDSDGTTILAEHDDEILGERLDSHLAYELLHNGTYYIRVRDWDHPNVGGTDYFYTIHLLMDNTNPSSAEITSPSNNVWLDPSLETVTVSASDDESGISHVDFLWHDADWENSDWVWLGIDWDGRDGWSWDFDTSGLAEQRGGAFYIWAFDWAGNWTGAGTWNLGIDRSPPTVSAGVQQMYGDAPFLDFWVTWWGAWDNLSGVASYDVQYRDGSGGTWTALLTDTTDTYYRFVGQDGHTYYFRTRARDYAGNMGTYASGDGDVEHKVQICPTSADAYEPDNSYTVAETVTTDGTWQSHNFHIDGDQDWVEFTATAGITYTMVTTNTGGHADTVLYLYESDGNTLIDSNDDDPNNWPASRLEWGATRGGTYYVQVEHWDPHAYGCTTVYGLSIAETGSFEVSNGVFLPIILRNAR